MNDVGYYFTVIDEVIRNFDSEDEYENAALKIFAVEAKGVLMIASELERQNDTWGTKTKDR